jgi:hypothetical protein
MQLIKLYNFKVKFFFYIFYILQNIKYILYFFDKFTILFTKIQKKYKK